MKQLLSAIIVLLGCLIFSQTTLAQSGGPGRLRIQHDLPYTAPAGGSSQSALVDLYYLPGRKEKQLLVFVHGGSWKGGDKSNLRKTKGLVRHFVTDGYVVAAPNFRLFRKNSTSYVDQARDIAHAIAWLKKNGSAFGVNKPGIILVGYSSGAHLVALLAADERYLRETGLSHKDIKGAISLDVHAYNVPYALQLMKGSELEHNIPLIKSIFGYSSKQQLKGSPVSYINRAQVPPTLLISAGVPRNHNKGYIAKVTTEEYAKKLRKAGHTAHSQHFNDETHSSLVMDFGRSGDGPTETVDRFLYSLKK